MMSKVVSVVMLTLLFVDILSLVFGLQQIEASGTIYIRADGNVEGTDEIQRNGNLYIFADNIYEPIVVERSNTIIDGAGYALEGTGTTNGLVLFSLSNVTIKNIRIKSYSSGIILLLTSNCTIINSNIIDNFFGIHLPNSSNYNTVSGNVIEDNGAGIWLDDFSNYNFIFGNNITDNIHGISLVGSFHNTIFENNLANNDFGVWLHPSCFGNRFYRNCFVGNIQQVNIPQENHNHDHHPLANVWDDGIGQGNYWSDYEERYPNATEIHDSGIWNTPYVIDENNQDKYPIVPEFPSFLIPSLFTIATLLAVIVYRTTRKKEGFQTLFR